MFVFGKGELSLITQTNTYGNGNYCKQENEKIDLLKISYVCNVYMHILHSLLDYLFKTSSMLIPILYHESLMGIFHSLFHKINYLDCFLYLFDSTCLHSDIVNLFIYLLSWATHYISDLIVEIIQFRVITKKKINLLTYYYV